MATITIRNLEESIKKRLRIRAATHNNSMEEEVRLILHDVLENNEKEGGLGTLIHKRFLTAGGVELPEQKRKEFPRKPDFLG